MSTVNLLRSVGLRHTEARRLVLELLDRSDRPLSHQEIATDPEIARMDRVTLYRTLTTLEKAGLLHGVQGVDGVRRFARHQSSSPGRCGSNHVHFLCLQCRRMSCLPEQALPWVKEPPGAEIFGKQLVVYGRCAACRSKGGTEVDRGREEQGKVKENGND